MDSTNPNTAQQEANRDPSLEATRQKFNDAFNRFDAKEVASFWAEDGTLLTPGGDFGKGRSGVERAFQKDASTILAGSRSTFTIVGMRRIGTDAALLDLDHDLSNFARPDGTTGPFKLHLVLLARKTGSSWESAGRAPLRVHASAKSTVSAGTSRAAPRRHARRGATSAGAPPRGRASGHAVTNPPDQAGPSATRPAPSARKTKAGTQGDQATGFRPSELERGTGFEPATLSLGI